jgi:hypothetical protein
MTVFKITRRQAVTAGLVAAGAAAAVAAGVSLAGKGKVPLSPPGKHGRASAVLDAMEGFRKEIPPAQGRGEQNGLSVEGLEPYTMPHLSGVAARLGVGTRTECLFLMTYLKDGDLKLRLIAIEAINKATGAYPNGWSLECLTDTGSEGHRKMLFRFLEVIEKLPI